MFQRQILRSSRTASRRLTQNRQFQRVSSSPLSTLRDNRAALSQFTTAQYQSRRWQSTEPSKSDAKPAEGEAKAAESTPEDALKQEIEKKNKEIVDLKDKYLRSVADYRNLQDRTTRDNAAARQFAIQRFATDLLESIDNLDRALSSVPDAALGKSSSSTASSSSPDTVTSTTSSPDANVGAPSESTEGPNQDLVNLHSGLRMTEKILLQTLAKHGLEKYDPQDREGKKFDPNLDEATFFTKVEGKGDGEVFYTQQKGYLLNGRVIRASKVGVVKNT